MYDRVSGIIYCDAQNTHSSNTQQIVSDIQMDVLAARENGFKIKFLWTPSNDGISNHDTVDVLTKTACNRPVVQINIGFH